MRANPKRQPPQPSPAASPATAASLPPATWAGAALIVLLVFLIYYPALSGGFLLDDDRLLTESKIIKAADGLYRFWLTTEPYDYWPVSNTTLWLEWRLWGLNPTGYHVTNLLLHIVETYLVWLLLVRLSVPGAYFAALLFAVHPVNVETVAWISQRKSLLATFFLLLSILAYLKSEAISGARGKSSAKPLTDRWYWLSLLEFALAMLSKVSAAVLPLLLLGLVWWKRALGKRDLLRIAPFFVVFAGLLQVNLWFRTHGAAAPVATAGFIERLLGAGAVVWFYLYKALFPLDLIFLYPEWHVDIQQWWWWCGLPAAIATTAVLWWYRDRWSRPLLLAWGFFCTALLPVLGFTDVGFMQHVVVADHYQHVALIAVVALVAAAWRVHVCGRTKDALAHAVAVALIGALSVLAWQQSRLYVDGETLYRATVAKNPSSWMAHNNLGAVLSHAGRSAEAIEHYEAALRLFPDYPDAHNNLGAMLRDAGRGTEAVAHFQEAIRLQPDAPEAYTNLGNVFLDEKRYAEAIEQYHKAQRLDPDRPEVLNNLGNALRESGRLVEAIESYRRTLQRKPDYAIAHNNLGTALSAVGQHQEALRHFKEAVRLTPDSANFHNTLGSALAEAGELPQAIEHFEQALRLIPEHADARFNLGLAFDRLGRMAEAIEHYRQAIQLNPNHYTAQNNLGNALAASGNFAESIAYFEAAIRVQPDYLDARFNLAMALGSLGQVHEASLQVQEALKLKPDDAQAWANAVLAYTALQQPAEAIGAAERSLVLARAQDQTALVKKMEDWLAANGAVGR